MGWSLPKVKVPKITVPKVPKIVPPKMTIPKITVPKAPIGGFGGQVLNSIGKATVDPINAAHKHTADFNNSIRKDAALPNQINNWAVKSGLGAGGVTGLLGADAATGGALSTTAGLAAGYNKLGNTQKGWLDKAANLGVKSGLGAGAFGADLAGTGGLLSTAAAGKGIYDNLGPAQQRWVNNGIKGTAASAVAAGALGGDPIMATIGAGWAAQQAGKNGMIPGMGGSNGNAGNGPGSGGSGTGVSDSDWEKMRKRIEDSEYDGARNPDGTLKDAYKVDRPGYTTGIQQGYVDMYDEGMSPGMSRWGQAAYDRSRADQGYALEDARGQAMQDAGAGMNTLAMQGGLESGAAENMLRSSGRTASNTRTNLYRQGSMDRMGIDVADAARKDTMRTQGLAGGMDVARYDTDLQNLNKGRGIDDLDKFNQFEAGKLGMEGQMMGAKAVSNAMMNSGGTSKGGLFGGMFNGMPDFLNPDPSVSIPGVINGGNGIFGKAQNFWGGLSNPSGVGGSWKY